MKTATGSGVTAAGGHVEIPLAGPAGEPVDLWRTLASHGIASLPPAELDEDRRRLTTTVRLPGRRPRTIVIGPGRPGSACVSILGRAPSARTVAEVERVVRRMLALERDLSGFYALAATDPDVAWAASGAGRMLRSPTVFEDVVKTVLTTNCSWAATVRMVGVLVEHLGEPAAGAPASGPYGRAFPTPAAMASRDEAFYRDVVRAGYRAPYLRALAAATAAGELDLEALDAAAGSHTDDDVYRALVSLPGIGPYAAAHVMLLLGRHSLLILDSWTRPKYARLRGRRSVTDASIARRWRRFGAHAGLAFWLFVTSDWA